MRPTFRIASHREQRRALEASVITAAQLEVVLVAFLNRGFFGRLKWLLFGR